MPQKTRVGNDRSQSTTDVARRRNRNEKLYKAGARSSVTLAAQNADRRAAVSEIELALSTHTGRSLFSIADVQRYSSVTLRRCSQEPRTTQNVQLLDHLVRAHQQRLRDRQSKRLRG